MGEVVQGNFGKPKEETDYGYKKISEAGVNSLAEVRHTLLNATSLSYYHISELAAMMGKVIDKEIRSKHWMTNGNQEV